MTFGELRVGVDFNPSGNTLVDTIKRKAADLIDHINGLETADFNEPGEVARLKALAMTDIESAAHWAVKASARSGAAQRRLVTTLRQFCDLVGWLRLRRWLQAIERVAEVERAARATAPAGKRRAVDKVAKAPHATPAARLERRPPRGRAPRARFLARLESPDAARRSATLRTATALRRTLPPALDPLTSPRRARRSPRRRRSLAPPVRPAASTRPARRQPRRPHAACLAPVEAPRPLQLAPAPLHSSHQTPHRPRHRGNPGPSIARRPHPEMPAWALATAPRHRSGVESALKAALAALTGTTARCALAMHPARSVRRNIAASTATSCVSALP